MVNYKVAIGLEVHVHLATESKLFCSCSTRFGEEPNNNVCEICSGMPGALPVPNREAIKYAIILGLATHCKINLRSQFARKNYFYPDLPNGYQISQFDLPVCESGYITIGQKEKKVGIIRIHLENDAGKNIHYPKENLSFVDLNRAGVPLVEIVSEPALNSPEEAVEYLKTLHSLVTYLQLSDGNMEEGSFRCDANISLAPAGSDKLGTRTELKNLNSFRHVLNALEYETERQNDLLIKGEKIIQETRLYDADKNITIPMRSKEEAEDYRYFPDPDLLPVIVSEIEVNTWKENLPELPKARCKKIMNLTGLPEAEINNLIRNRDLADLYEKIAMNIDPKKAASFMLGPLFRLCNEKNLSFSPKKWPINEEKFIDLLTFVEKGVISNKGAADILPLLFDTDVPVKEIIDNKGLFQISDETLINDVIKDVLLENGDKVEEYKKGKTKLISFFMGQVMKKTKGKANPGLVTKLMEEQIRNS